MRSGCYWPLSQASSLLPSPPQSPPQARSHAHGEEASTGAALKRERSACPVPLLALDGGWVLPKSTRRHTGKPSATTTALFDSLRSPCWAEATCWAGFGNSWVEAELPPRSIKTSLLRQNNKGRGNISKGRTAEMRAKGNASSKVWRLLCRTSRASHLALHLSPARVTGKMAS